MFFVLNLIFFQFQPVQPDGIWVFFLLANRSEVAGAKTKWYCEEIDVMKAHEKLNASLAAGDIEIEIDKEKVNFLLFFKPVIMMFHRKKFLVYH